jgi:hypothetical protein
MDKITKLHVSHENFTNFSGRYRDAIFSDKMIHYFEDRGHSKTDPIQEYKLNSSGYRSPEFENNVDLLVAGCSFTYGMGVPENLSWGPTLARLMGVKYNNLSLSGVSIPWIVGQLFAYFNQYGNPKTLVCLFPNLTRTLFCSDPEILISSGGIVEKSTADHESKKSLYNVDLTKIIAKRLRPKYSKLPHNLEDVANPDSAVQISMQNIRMLEQYCRSSGIDFYWGSWHHPLCQMIEDQGLSEDYNFSNYVPTEHKLWDHSPKPDCHQELMDSCGPAFHIGTDDLLGKPHFGVHRHVHIAESFMKEIAGNGKTR